MILSATLLASATLTLTSLVQSKPDSMTERLDRLVRTTEFIEPGGLSAAIVALGPEVADPLVRLLEVRNAERDGANARRAELERAVTELGRPAFEPLWLAEPGAPDDPSRCLALLDVLSLVGRAEDLKEAVRISTGPEGLGKDPRNTTALVGAISEILGRDPEAWFALRPMVVNAPPSSASVLLQSVGSFPTKDALLWLANVLREDPELTLSTLSQMGRVASSAPPRAPAEVAQAVRSLLNDHNPQIAREAIRVVGLIEDFGSLELLIALLAAEDAGRSAQAHAALCEITGLSFPADPAPWHAWYDSELRWFTERSEACFQALEVGRLEQIRAALQELVGHRLDRHLIADEVEGLLEFEAPELRLVACTALAQIGSRTSLPSLRAMLEDEDKAVAREARRALDAICGITTPAAEAPRVAARSY